MDLRQLTYLVAVADHGGFTAAARAVHVSQPSLSHGIRVLEAELGVELFARLGRSVSPTASGAAVIAAARRVLREVADLEAAVAAIGALEQGRLVLAALPTLAVDPLAAMLGGFRRAHPGVVLRVLESEDPAGVEQRVRAGEAELGLTDITSVGRGLRRVPLFRQDLVAVSPPDADASPDPLTPAALAALPLVVTPPRTSTRRLLDAAFSRHGIEPRIAVELTNREAIVPLVLAGAGTSIMSASLAASAAQQGAVVRSLRPALSRRIGLVHRRAALSPAAAALVALARDRLTPTA